MSTRKRISIYLLAAALLTLVGILLRSAALCRLVDGTGYFTRSPLVTVLYILEAVSLIAAFSLPFFIKKGELTDVRPPLSLLGMIAAGLAVTATIAVLAVLLATAKSLAASPLFIALSVLGLLLTFFYFGLLFLAKEPPRATLALLGYGPMLAAMGLIAVTHFDLYTAANSPHKLSIHLALLSVAVYMLFELRYLLSSAKPRAATVVATIAFFLCLSAGLSNAAAFLAGVYKSALLFAIDLFLVALALYVAARTVEPLFGAPAEAPAADDEQTSM